MLPKHTVSMAASVALLSKCAAASKGHGDLVSLDEVNTPITT